MKKINVTKMEAQVLNALAECMYAELGFSDAGFHDVVEITKLPVKTVRAIGGTLEQKNLLLVDRREGEMFFNEAGRQRKSKSSDWIWYLGDDVRALVPNWRQEDSVEPCELIITD